MDRGILNDRANPHSIVLDLPFGLRGGIPVDGVPFFAQALVMATEDGHPRSIAYTSRVPRPTIDAINHHPFYAAMIDAEHEVARTCPWRPAGLPQALNSCDHPYGVVPPGPQVAVNKVSEYLTPKRLAAAIHAAAKDPSGKRRRPRTAAETTAAASDVCHESVTCSPLQADVLERARTNTGGAQGDGPGHTTRRRGEGAFVVCCVMKYVLPTQQIARNASALRIAV